MTNKNSHYIIKELRESKGLSQEVHIAGRGLYYVVCWILATSFRPAGQERAPKSARQLTNDRCA